MRRPLTAFLLAAAAVPAPAAAAGFGELPFHPSLGGASCVRTPGAPGEVARAADGSLELLRADASGLRPTGVALPGAFTFLCPAVASAPSGAGVAADLAEGDDASRETLAAALRDPGGGWANPQVLGDFADAPTNLSAAVSDRGDAAVGATLASGDGKGQARVILARRAPGSAFSAPVTLASAPGDAPTPVVRVGFAADGELVAAWTHRDGSDSVLDVAVAPPGAALGAAQRIATLAPDAAAPPALAVAPDGRTLLAYVSGGHVWVAERAPGGGFGAAAAVASASDLGLVWPELALRPDGAAAVSWQGLIGRGVGVAVRPAAGPFGAPVTLARSSTEGAVQDVTAPSGLLTELGLAADELLGGHVRVALAGGSALVSWPSDAVTRGIEWIGVRVATLPLAGGHVDVERLGSPLRDLDSAAPLALADGTPAIAWADDAGARTRGRVHLAVAGAAPVRSARMPRVRVGRPRRSVLRRSQALRLPVTCSAACDVRLQLQGGSGDDELLSLPRAGTRTVEMLPLGKPIAPARRGPVRLRVASGPPGSLRPLVRTVAVTLRRAR